MNWHMFTIESTVPNNLVYIKRLSYRLSIGVIEEGLDCAAILDVPQALLLAEQLTLWIESCKGDIARQSRRSALSGLTQDADNDGLYETGTGFVDTR